MDADKALELIASAQPHERLRGARHLARLARLTDISRMQRALAEETVPWVRNALERALAVASPNSTFQDPSLREAEGLSDATRRDIYLKMGDEIVSTVLHEIQPKVGFIRNAASREITDFENSNTRRRIEYLEEMLVLLAEFRRVSKPPKSVEFDLADLIDQVVTEQQLEQVLLAGNRPLLALGEPNRVRLALTNGLRNAIEATAALAVEKRGFITINWGATNAEYWVSIVDQGVGLQASTAAMFHIGRTTKAGHYGMGLPLAQQAMSALGGTVLVSPGATNGTRFEVRWERVLPPKSAV